MTADAALQDLIHKRLELSSSGDEPWAYFVLTALDGDAAFQAALQPHAPVAGMTRGETPPPPPEPAKVFLQEIRVRGFRGIGPETALTLAPGPGLTLVVGRNGCGKSSFAEAAELLITRGNSRWDERYAQWKEGFRNLHDPRAAISARFTVEGGRSCEARIDWADEAGVVDRTESVQFAGEARTTWDALGWSAAAVSYRPVLSYNELGRILEQEPSKFFDALARILGIESLTDGAARLRTARLEREKVQKEIQKAQKDLAAKAAAHADPRGAQAAAVLKAKAPDLAALDAILEGSGATDVVAKELATLRRVVALPEMADAEAAQLAEMIRIGSEALRAHSGTLASRSAELAALLDSALRFHEAHGDPACPVCERAGALDTEWRARQTARLAELRDAAKQVNDARAVLAQARQIATRAVGVDAALLQAATALSLPAGAVAASAAQVTAALALEPDASAPAFEAALPAFRVALAELRRQAGVEVARREDLWRPMADELRTWLARARQAQDALGALPQIALAEKWLNEATDDLRRERFAPHASEVKRIWEQLRHSSNVSLEDIRLTGAANSRRVQLDVAVDGTAGAAVGVMSQGELHSLALALFLPRATMAASPFGFVVIDDPVQSMDPARVDGLARVLSDTAKSRQVVVFTHDDRLPESVRRQGLDATILEVSRREKSQVEVKRGADPVSRYLDDALALSRTENLPSKARARVVPGLCRGAVEAAAIQVLRARWLNEGLSREVVEERLESAEKTSHKLALVFFGTTERAGDVSSTLNKESPDYATVFRAIQEGAHGPASEMDAGEMVKLSERLTRWIQSRK